MKNELDIDKKLYLKTKFTVNFQLFVIALAVSVLIGLIAFEMVFHNANVPKNNFFGVLLPLPLMVLCGIAAGTFLLTCSFNLLFSKQMILKKLGDGYYEFVERKLEESFFETFGEKSSKTVGTVLLVLGIAAVVIFSINNIGFYDDYCKFSDSHNIIVHKVYYDDLTLYRIDGWYEDTRYYKYDGNAYALVSSDGKSYDLGNVSGELESKLLSYFDGKVEEAKSVDSILIDIDSER